MSNDVDTDAAAAADMYNDVDHNVGAYMDATWPTDTDAAC